MKRSDGTEKRIIEAALGLFVRHGYHGTSINDIMREVGLSKGALYAHFRSKGELLLRIIEEFKRHNIDVMIQTVDESGGNAVDKLHRTFSFNSRFAYEHQNLVVFLTFLTTELKADVDFEPALKNVYKEYQEFVSGLIRQGMDQGLFKKEIDPDLAALSFIALHDGVLHQWVLNRSHLDGERYAKTFRKIFFYGLASSPDPTAREAGGRRSPAGSRLRREEGRRARTGTKGIPGRA
jgi:AcrR family transcriptional regulator